MPNELSCSCCGVPKRIYQEEGHDWECIWYEDEMYRLAAEWIARPESDESDWKKKYDLVVSFLLEQIKWNKKGLEE